MRTKHFNIDFRMEWMNEFNHPANLHRFMLTKVGPGETITAQYTEGDRVLSFTATRDAMGRGNTRTSYTWQVTDENGLYLKGNDYMYERYNKRSDAEPVAHYEQSWSTQKDDWEWICLWEIQKTYYQDAALPRSVANLVREIGEDVRVDCKWILNPEYGSLTQNDLHGLANRIKNRLAKEYQTFRIYKVGESFIRHYLDFLESDRARNKCEGLTNQNLIRKLESVWVSTLSAGNVMDMATRDNETV